MEHLFKSLAFSPEEVSVVEPEFYQQRFVNFIKGLVNEPPQHEGKQKKIVVTLMTVHLRQKQKNPTRVLTAVAHPLSQQCQHLPYPQ